MKAIYLKTSLNIFCLLSLSLLIAPMIVVAKSAPDDVGIGAKQSYIIILDDPPLAAYDGRELRTPERDVEVTRLTATANHFTGANKLDVHSPESQRYLQFLDERFASFRGEALLQLGRQIKPVHRYRNATNGFATSLSQEEAAALRKMPNVISVEVDKVQRLLTDSGPRWIGADKVHAGTAGYPASGGEGVVVGVIDTGINWDHDSFSDPGQGLSSASGKWDHVNPYGLQLGLCSLSQVRCNDKLVGVYDFVKDVPGTTQIEENTNGKDNIDHGSLSASIVAGNPGVDFAPYGGVAPNANIISYRVCFLGDVNGPDGDSCQGSAILSAIDQALADGVDVVNYSIGDPSAFNPWSESSARAYLNLRAAGIFVVTSAGNEGREESTVGTPANAPWITSVGAATHDRIFANFLGDLSGGDTSPPDDLFGSSLSDGIGIRKIVHAKDHGNALCGQGEAELQPTCSSNSGVQSNPFSAGTFNGEIVVCDRGTYGRVEKGKNVMTAGAAGYVLANIAGSSPQNVVADDHCLPAIHLGRADGDLLRVWLDSGGGHQASISAASLLHIPEAGDVMAAFSSRGPNTPYAENVMKPDLIAPGVDIFGAAFTNDDLTYANGTSFSSPHVAGAGALIKSVHPDWSPAMIASALMMTATAERAIDFDFTPANVHVRGAGRPRLDQAINAGLYLDETEANFLAANPAIGGVPSELNLPGLVQNACVGSCSFTRTVTDLVGGGSWSASTVSLAEGVSVTVSPNDFTLADGASQALTINIKLERAELVGQWLFGEVHLSSSEKPDAVFPLAVYASPEESPEEWVINSDSDSGYKDFTLEAKYDMPDATFTAGGLVVPDVTLDQLPQDPTEDDPYDNLTGILTTLHQIPDDTLMFHSSTLTSSAVDLDLFVGLDANGNGVAEESEELCSSHTPTDIERCDLNAPVAGNYWVIVQNWKATNSLDDVTLKTAVVGKDTTTILNASGNGIIPADTSHAVRLSWDNVGDVPGTELIGAVGIGSHRSHPNNLGVFPVTFRKTSIAAPETLVLMNGVSRSFSLSAGVTHDRIVVDIPPGVVSLTFSSSAKTADGDNNDALELSLYQMDFDEAFTEAPVAVVADMSVEPLGTATGTVGSGPSLMVSDGNVTAGRWYAVLKNTSATDVNVEIKADIQFTGSPTALSAGLWQPSSRPDLNQGFDYATTGDYRAFLWYTYDETGQPAWYLAAGPEPAGNVWVAELERFTNDGSLQQSTKVGHVSVSMLSELDSIFSFVLFGEQGSDRMMPSSSLECPQVNGENASYTGLWSRPDVGVGGASVLTNEESQGYLHYIYDAQGKPVWLLGASESDGLPHAELPLLQYSGYCAVCEGPEPSNQQVGVFTLDYADESHAEWRLNYALVSPLTASVDRIDAVEKLTVPLNCQ
jgi:subtilisin family serine protease